MEDNYDKNVYGSDPGTESAPEYSYENYAGDSGSTQDNTYSGGNYYQYNSSGNSYYSTEDSGRSYEGTSYSGSSYSGSDYGEDGGSGKSPAPRKKSHGKAALAIVLALIFCGCVGISVWGVNRYLRASEVRASVSESTPSVQEQEEPAQQAQEPEKAAPEETVPQEEPAQQAEEPAQQEEEPAQQAEEPGTAVAQETEPAASVPEETAPVTQEETVNEAGLIISNSDSKGRETAVTKVVDQVMPSIVSVYNNYTEQVNFFGQVYSQEAESTGSGIIVGKTDDKLLIATNHHVVSGAEQLRVLFIDEETCEAEIIGTDASNDLAVISVNLSDLKQSTLSQVKVATLGNSENVKVGEQAIAIGNALGYGQSVTTGIVSATEREIQSDQGITGTFIQTDAAINPGNSGGALVNIDGEVIGINSSKIGGSTIEGMGFAIPISRAIPIIGELISQESRPKVAEDRQGTIGISGQSVTSDVASAYNMPQGVYVFQILENGGAANSDLQVGDVITAINGVNISTMEELHRQLQYYEAGTTVTLTVQRQGRDRVYEEVSVDVTLGTKESIKTGEQSGREESRTEENSGSMEDYNSREENQNRNPFGGGYGFPFGN